MGAEDAGRMQDVTCDEILAAYSEYVDGVLPAHEAARVQWHLAACDACGRYDRVLRRGAELVRELPLPTPSADFTDRLQHRIFHLQDGPAIEGTRATGGGAAAGVAVAGVIALLAWSPILLVGGSDGAPAAAAAAAVSAAPHVAPAATTPLVRPGDSWLGPATTRPLGPPTMTFAGSDAVHVLASFPGPHSPLIVSPPLHRAVRTVSSGYSPIE